MTGEGLSFGFSSLPFNLAFLAPFEASNESSFWPYRAICRLTLYCGNSQNLTRSLPAAEAASQREKKQDECMN
jgi:hypothetical protein